MPAVPSSIDAQDTIIGLAAHQHLDSLHGVGGNVACRSTCVCNIAGCSSSLRLVWLRGERLLAEEECPAVQECQDGEEEGQGCSAPQLTCVGTTPDRRFLPCERLHSGIHDPIAVRVKSLNSRRASRLIDRYKLRETHLVDVPLSNEASGQKAPGQSKGQSDHDSIPEADVCVSTAPAANEDKG